MKERDTGDGGSEKSEPEAVERPRAPTRSERFLKAQEMVNRKQQIARQKDETKKLREQKQKEEFQKREQ